MEIPLRNYKTKNFIEDTKKEFQRYFATELTDAEAIEIRHNLISLVELLLEWAAEEEERSNDVEEN